MHNFYDFAKAASYFVIRCLKCRHHLCSDYLDQIFYASKLWKIYVQLLELRLNILYDIHSVTLV